MDKLVKMVNVKPCWVWNCVAEDIEIGSVSHCGTYVGLMGLDM